MKQIFKILLVVSPLLLANEPSVYGAGNLDASSPYGLTSSEKHILKNKKHVKDLEQGVGSVKIKLNQINENYEGLRSVTESIGSKIAKIDKKMLILEQNSKTVNSEFFDVKKEISEIKRIQDANQEKVKLVLAELSSLIDSINNNYLSKDEFVVLEKKVNSLLKSKKASKLSTKSGATLLKEGRILLSNKKYNSAKIRFEQLIRKRYMPARSTFYLAEVAYFQKNYNTAIKHYKKSISLYDKADYMPTLLYHTGISFSKLKKTTQAKQFFDALKQSYPNSKVAKSLK